LRKKSLERGLPPRAQSWNTQSALNICPGGSGKIEQRADRGNIHALRAVGNFDDFVAGAYFAFFEDTQVEPRAVMLDQQSRHPGLIHSNANTVACHTRLRHLKQRIADPVTVADAYGMVVQSFDREVLAELSVNEAGPLQVLLPIAIRFDLVDQYGSLLTPMSGQVTLTISRQIQPTDPTAATHRILPDRGVHSAPSPLDIARKSDVHR
jgi:hypothetical protein